MTGEVGHLEVEERVRNPAVVDLEVLHLVYQGGVAFPSFPVLGQYQSSARQAEAHANEAGGVVHKRLAALLDREDAQQRQR